ncbi:MAG: hypothetical protein PVJ84_00905 [Desulfobacteraceae bacterium]
MAILDYLKKFLKRGEPDQPAMEYVRDEPSAPEDEMLAPRSAVEKFPEMDSEIDLSRQADLEGYARDTNMSKESIERWISSGLLMPEELKVAEKLVKLMRDK